MYCASADWMPRNLERRVEIMFPILNDELKSRVCYILSTLLADTVKARVGLLDGSYERIDKRGKELICAQQEFCYEAARRVKLEEEPVNSRVFIPVETNAEEI